MSGSGSDSGGQVLGGRYRLEGSLGAGGMARVHVATDEVLGRRVAVKIIRDDLGHDPVLRERLEREARAAASFSHPNAVAVYDVGEDAGTPFIVMELVEGMTLADRLREVGPLPVDEALSIIDDVLAALGAAHARDLVHRDVKPANVLLPADGSGAKLADFGIAKGVRDAMAGLTATGQILGTPRYLAPEQVAGEAATPRSDLYAAGVLCYELLAGRPPFDGEHAIAVALMHQHETAPPLRKARPDAPRHVVAALERAMAKDPAVRFADAGEMRTALRSPRSAAAPTQAVPAAAATTQVLSPADTGLPPTQAMDSTQAVRTAAEPAASPRRGLPAGAILAAVLVLGLLAAVLALRDGGDLPLADEPTAPPEEGADPDVAEPVEAEAEPDPDPDPDPDPEPEPDDPTPSTPEELLAFLDRDPTAFGEKGEDLRDDLADLLGKKPKDQPKEARKLIEESGKWAREGELDPAVAELTAVVLAPMAQEEERGEDGSGGGPPGEDDDEDED